MYVTTSMHGQCGASSGGASGRCCWMEAMHLRYSRKWSGTGFRNQLQVEFPCEECVLSADVPGPLFRGARGGAGSCRSLAGEVRLCQTPRTLRLSVSGCCADQQRGCSHPGGGGRLPGPQVPTLPRRHVCLLLGVERASSGSSAPCSCEQQ